MYVHTGIHMYTWRHGPLLSRYVHSREPGEEGVTTVWNGTVRSPPPLAQKFFEITRAKKKKKKDTTRKQASRKKRAGTAEERETNDMIKAR